ncbi:MAG: adenylyl-sulfate kinase [Deltaproteobacteria bacterium]|nr:adenylyl-sulfate kinase [Deltaproteobacteria bacterium]
MQLTKEKAIVWIMGPTSAGKTTLAKEALHVLRKKGLGVIHYDGDEVRDFFGPDFGFNRENRLIVVSTIVHLANKSLDAGLNVIVSALTANSDARNFVRKNAKNLILVSLECRIETCIRRDRKGLYAQALKGEINTVVGLNSKYDAIENPDIVIDTDRKSKEESVGYLIEQLNSTLRLKQNVPESSGRCNSTLPPVDGIPKGSG